MYHILFIHTFTLFPPFDIMNNAAMNIHVQGLTWTYVFISLVYKPRNGITGSYGNSMFKFKNCRLFSKAAAPFYIPTSSVQVF